MNGFVATSRPAGALLDAGGVIGTADQESAAGLLLEMTFQAKIGVADCQ